jgi:hypothetical protein
MRNRCDQKFKTCAQIIVHASIVLVMTPNTDFEAAPLPMIDIKKERYPFCVVWTPIPLITYETKPFFRSLFGKRLLG